LEADRQQQVLWSSDGGSTMRINGNTRILEMNENVKVTQGSLEIIGSEAIFEYLVSTNELTKVTVRGSPVQYQQQLDEDGNLVTGTSDTLVFYSDELDETILELVGDANIESPDSTMSCAAIIYIADQDLIREATGPCQGILSSQPN
jgi:lipopolysaccharide transport protein LptA